MAKYTSFKEYLQENYIEYIKDLLSKFIEKHCLKVKVDNKTIKFDDYYINEILITNVNFTKSEIKNVECDVHFRASYDCINNKTNPPIISQSINHFILPIRGTFEDGFKEYDRLELYDEQDSFSKTLVPIMKYEDLEKYATKFLKEFCPEALEAPIRIDIDEILNKKDIKWFYAKLDDNVLGETYFAEDVVEIYDGDSLVQTEVTPGTILIDHDKHWNRPEGVLRNTIIHECVHWYFHRNYFELKKCLDDEFKSYKCQKSDGQIVDAEIYWMEWQARNLAPRILMPKKPLTIKVAELQKEIDDLCEILPMSIPEKWAMLVERIASFFGVSKASAKYRLRQAGYSKVDGVLNWINDQYIKAFTFKNKYLEKNQTFIITDLELAELIKSNFQIKDAILSEKLLFANNMLVANNPKYIDYNSFELTEYALNHAHECCVVFDIEKANIIHKSTSESLYYLNNINTPNKHNKSTNSTIVSKMMNIALKSSQHYESHKQNLPETFSETLDYHINKAFENKIVDTYDQLADEADVTVTTLRRYRKGEVSEYSLACILKIAFALKLSSPYIQDLLFKAEKYLLKNNIDNSLINSIIYTQQRRGLEYIATQLVRLGRADILELSDKYIQENVRIEEENI